MCENPSPQVDAEIGNKAVGTDAYIHVRVPNDARSDGSVVVYLSNGTGLVVNCDQLVRLPILTRDPRLHLAACNSTRR